MKDSDKDKYSQYDKDSCTVDLGGDEPRTEELLLSFLGALHVA